VNLSQRLGDVELQGEYAIQRNIYLRRSHQPIDQPLIDRLSGWIDQASRARSQHPRRRLQPEAGALVGLNGELALPGTGFEVGSPRHVPAGVLLPALPSSPRMPPRAWDGTGFRATPLTTPDGDPILGGRDAVDRRVRDPGERTLLRRRRHDSGVRSRSARQPDTFDRDGTPIGGHAEIILNGEVRLALWDPAVGFLDTGNVLDREQRARRPPRRGRLRSHNSPVGPSVSTSG
jgi:hypothetical protein